MSDPTAAALAYWAAAEARDWSAFSALLHDDVVYELPQTRERISGRTRYLQFNVEYPGDWHLTVDRVVGAGRQAATWCHFTADGEPAEAVTFFELDEAGLVTSITEFWPAAYEPPAGRAHLMQRS
ncbi:nuclear transport factor 2 family protein [Asanoa sp. WMMD1127]|uniref:nuclear transport factor 2 family protein n=1 Tax=Asanoa sp. WMMD1127 TaxID=3016107 RepID=UPI002416C10F|nr:nuclear transport factor 2 family protein [Asanoa sp. WMMD1127]MDG4823191.1 nuclear transport factor 2 family protein [Asanoa sp. WMMD1127]